MTRSLGVAKSACPRTGPSSASRRSATSVPCNERRCMIIATVVLSAQPGRLAVRTVWLRHSTRSPAACPARASS
eukprot:15355870-Alexandrium_andersonii.AAC.1